MPPAYKSILVIHISRFFPLKILVETIYEARARVKGVNRCVRASANRTRPQGLGCIIGSAQEAELEILVHNARNAIFVETP